MAHFRDMKRTRGFAPPPPPSWKNLRNRQNWNLEFEKNVVQNGPLVQIMLAIEPFLCRIYDHAFGKII